MASTADNVESTGVHSGGEPRGPNSWSAITIINRTGNSNLILQGYAADDGTVTQAPRPTITPNGTDTMRVEGSFLGQSKGWVTYTIAESNTRVRIEFECPIVGNNTVRVVPPQNGIIGPFSPSGPLLVTVTIVSRPN